MLFVGVSTPPETFLARLINGLADAGVEVTVHSQRKPAFITPSRPSLVWLPAPSWDVAAAARLWHLGRMAVRAVVRAPKDVRLLARSGRRAQGQTTNLRGWHRLLPFAGRRWDVIYFPWNSAAISYLPLFDFDAPAVISCRGSQINVAPHNPQRAALREDLRTNFARAAAVHCVSEAIKREAMLYGLAETKARVIYPAVDEGFFAPAKECKSEDECLRVVSVGALKWVKGYEYALSAMRHLLDKGIRAHLSIIGEGADRPRLRYTISDLGLEAHVRLLGRLDEEEIKNQLRQADVFLLSSLSEGISNAALEAMACALPIVTTDCGGMREAVTDGEEGFVVPVRDAEAMAEALAKLAEDENLRRRMGRAAVQKVRGQFALNRQVEKFIALFQSISKNAEPLPDDNHAS